MRYKELVHSEMRGEFEIRFYAEEEDSDPAGHFASGDDALDAEVIRKINSGEYAWFWAHVVALKHGHELGHAYLGGCCYDRAKDFVEDSGYYPEMVDEAIMDARATLRILNS